ncbi:SpoIIIAC/SpoIIIAD family protein [Anaerovorax odorimutans]|uniref:SpoIIIAC/SpoIIIAD family protein n=1 Tax=Anaerovorax odorimutans TaxID=109327 RepID=UPI0003FC3449|nr:SpoIIIAC/SpoIIIAD family protein [Anaerovorax odorimutans]
MDMDIFKIAAIGLCGVIVASIVKGYKPEFATYIVITTVMIIFTMILYKLTAVFEFLGSIYSQISYGKTFFPIIIKVLAVAYIADFTAQICKDSGESAIAGKVELAGKVIIFYLAVPVMVSVLGLIEKMLPG